MASARQAIPSDSPRVPPAATGEAAPPDPASHPSLSQPEIEKRFEALLLRVQANRPTEDVSLIRKAWEFCVQHHEGQMRASGEPYIIHPLEVAEVLAEMKLDASAIAAGLLHDSVEDTPATNEEIAAEFGDQVAHIVEGVTKIDKIQFANREDRQAENVRKMLLAMVTDVRVVLIKLADRLHNMRTLEHLKPDRQEAIARETQDIYCLLYTSCQKHLANVFSLAVFAVGKLNLVDLGHAFDNMRHLVAEFRGNFFIRCGCVFH